MLKVVFDSNVYISALLFNGTPRKILQLARQGRITIVASDNIIKETCGKLEMKFFWPEHRIRQFKTQITKIAKMNNPVNRLKVIDDETDNRILECAVDENADIIISGDKHLLKLKSYNSIPIQSPKYLTYLIK